ncbi:MAG: hypothetical protein HY951_12840 [Bacteroidia bacterium]|nr:hypothetical protein [Bacteroidia bacterium]
MHKLVFLFLTFSNLLQAQESILSLAKDSDAVCINHSKIAEFKVTTICFAEKFDSLLFVNYPIPSRKIKFIFHKSNFNADGFSSNYEWSFAESDNLKKEEIEKSSGSFFIPNEYKYIFDNRLIQSIAISDASPITNISYHYSNDSIYQNITIYSTSTSSQVVKKVFHKNFNKSIYCNTGNKQHFFPVTQIISLGKISSNNIYVNDLPFMSFFDKIFDNNRFLIEIRTGLWILAEISD